MQAICRLVPGLRPTGRAGPAPGAATEAASASPTEFVDGAWRVIGTGRGTSIGTPARIGRRLAQGAAPLAATAAVTGGTILVCTATGWPDTAPPPPATQAIAGPPAQGDGIGLVMGGPSIFRLGGPDYDRLQVTGETRAPPDSAPVAVPEPGSILLFGSFLLLFGTVLLAAARQRRRRLHAAAAPPSRG